MPMATEFGRVAIYYKWLLPIKLHFPFITSCLEITRQTKTMIFQLPSARGHQTWQDGNLP